MAVFSTTLDLPAGFRREEVLAFHRRDRLQCAERVEAEGLEKGLMDQGRPASLKLRFAERRVEITFAVDGGGALASPLPLVRRMLGLTQEVAAFEQRFLSHPQLGALLARQSGLRVPLTATPFEALTWAIIGQQISVAAAVSVRRKLIQAAGRAHSGGLWCYPDAPCLAALSEADLRQLGFSQNKAQALRELSRRVVEGELPLDDWLAAPPVDVISRQLRCVRGIGPWTVNYGLLRGFGWLDGSLHGDAAVRRKLQILLALPEAVSETFAQRWLTEFSPWRALVAAHLWAMPG